MQIKIRSARAEDAKRFAEIYNYYVENTTITFEEVMVSEETMRQRLDKISAAGLPWLIAESQGVVMGYIYVSPWHQRSAYRFTVESSAYLAVDIRGKGIGQQLYQALFERLSHTQVRNIISVIALPNERSIGLHQKLGFEKTGELTEIGFKFNRPVSVSYWQYQLS